MAKHIIKEVKALNPMARILVRIPAANKRELEKIAREQGESLNTIIRTALRRFINV